jgi:hypothetical protein
VPRLLANQRLPLTRFWLPFVGRKENDGIPTIRLYHGVLPDPEDEYGKLSNPGITTLPNIQHKRCFALLGQPGLGKTIAIEQWLEELRNRAQPQDAIIYITGRGLAAPDEVRRDTIESADWRRARAANGEITLVLDGLDEALQRLPLLVTTLYKALKDQPPDRTRVVLVSRVADWRDSRAEQLFGLWPPSDRGDAFELCPLRWRDVRLAAEKSGVDAGKFETDVLERHVAWMAARPKLLLMLLEEFRQHKRLPDSRRELFERAATRMCEEHDSERHEILERSQRPVFPAKQTIPIVQRIAAILLLSGKTYILRDADVQPRSSDLPLTSVLGGNEPIEGGFVEVDKAVTLAALDTAHFVACGSARLGFDHQQMAEFAAAQYLRRCTARQLRNLLMQRIDGVDYLSPQFRELSAWIAVDHPEFRNDVARREPRLLLEADSVELDDSTRAAAVVGLLEQLDAGEVSDMYLSASLSPTLRYSGLAKQLREYITNRSHNIISRRTAISIARAARCTSLKEELWRLVALSPEEQISVLHAAAAAVADMGTRDDVTKFLHLLRHTADEEIKGIALRFLVPKYRSVASVIKYLAPRNENLIGVYYTALDHYLPDSVRAPDVLPILNEYERRRKRGAHTGPIRAIVTAAVRFALGRFNDRRLRAACARFLATELQNHDWRGTWEDLKPKDGKPTSERRWRRTLLDGFVARSKGRYLAFVRFGLWPADEDLGWVLKKLRESKGQQRAVWAHLGARMLGRGFPSELFPDIERAYAEVPAFRKQLPKPKRFTLEETLRRRVRAVEMWREVWRQRAERRKAEETKDQLSLPEVIQHLRRNEPLGWWIAFVRVLERLYRAEQNAGGYAKDIKASATWKALSPEDLQIVTRAARRFLLVAKAPKRAAGYYYHADQAAVRALALLRPQIRRSIPLRAATKQKWIPAILGESYNAESEIEALSCLAYLIDPNACLRWCKDELKRQSKETIGLHSLRRFKGCWNGRLTRVVASFAVRPRLKVRLLAYSFALLSEVAPADAKLLWKNSWGRSNKHPRSPRARCLTFLGLFAVPELGWAPAMARIQKSSRAEQIRIFAKHAYLLSYDFRDWSENLSDRQLAELYQLLVDLFPPDRLRDYARGGSVRARDHIGDIERACLNTLVTRATKSARRELRALADRIAGDNRLMVKWRLRDAIDERLRTKWVSDQPAAETIMKIVRVVDAVRVRDSGELQDAVMCSLVRLQSKMRAGEFPKLPQFWYDVGSRPKPEREISRIIAAWLHEDLGTTGGLVIDREPQVGFSGNMDIKVEMPAFQIPSRPRLRVIVEVKRCTHEHIATACATQLAEGYLRRKSIAHGVYLVAWFNVPQRKISWPSLVAAERDVSTWAANASDSHVAITGFVLDCRWIGMESPSSLAQVA